LFMPNVSHLFPDLFVTDVPPFSSPIFHSAC
jgi:hypothetical protein